MRLANHDLALGFVNLERMARSPVCNGLAGDEVENFARPLWRKAAIVSKVSQGVSPNEGKA